MTNPLLRLQANPPSPVYVLSGNVKESCHHRPDLGSDLGVMTNQEKIEKSLAAYR